MPANIYIPVLPRRENATGTGGFVFRAARGLSRQHVQFHHAGFRLDLRSGGRWWQLDREVLVYPCIDAQTGIRIAAGRMWRARSNRGSKAAVMSFYRIRPYEAMESARHVDWKATGAYGRTASEGIRAGADRAAGDNFP